MQKRNHTLKKIVIISFLTECIVSMYFQLSHASDSYSEECDIEKYSDEVIILDGGCTTLVSRSALELKEFFREYLAKASCVGDVLLVGDALGT